MGGMPNVGGTKAPECAARDGASQHPAAGSGAAGAAVFSAGSQCATVLAKTPPGV